MPSIGGQSSDWTPPAGTGPERRRHQAIAPISDLFARPGDGGASRPNLDHFCLVTERADLEAPADELTQAGVAIERGASVRAGARGDGMSVSFRDSDATVIELRTSTA